jgi:ectoine hydroxylase-related dioxygenase (phytanoyl-CoA dioxygenase family)
MHESILNENFALSGDAIPVYRRDGHVFLPQVLPSAELAGFRKVVADAVRRDNRETRPLEERDTYHKAFLQVCNLWTRHEEVARFVLARRFARIAAELMGVDSVRIYHDQALFKEAGGGFTPWHQDQYYWPLDTDKTITMWMPLVDVEEDMGMMEFVSGTHLERFIADHAISDASELFFNGYIAQKGLTPTGPVTARAGDATFHAGWTLHRARPNGSNQCREVMTVIYFADGARIEDPVRDAVRGDLEAWLEGRAPGQLAASSLNPVVWPD